jgi:tryptophan halogenase
VATTSRRPTGHGEATRATPAEARKFNCADVLPARERRMDDVIEDVTIVGGGDSGLLTALAIELMNPGIDVSVIDDFGRNVPQVGKSTYRSIGKILHDTLAIDEQRFVAAVKPVWKCTVYFRDWCDSEFHFPFDVPVKFPNEDATDAVETCYYYYDELYDSPDHRTKGEEIVDQGMSPWHYSPREGRYKKYEHIAYHLNTERFNSFLRELCRERSVSLIDDEIVSVETTGNRIDRVRSKSQAYESDLFVDASGFSRVLKGELGGEFRDFGFPLDTAYNVRVDRPLSEVIPATVVETGDHGWFWHIDTYDNRDLGYVYASEYVSDEAARAEFLDHVAEIDHEDGSVSAADLDRYEFSSGYFEQPWAENCLAIGNAVGFVEPLQSTGLTVNAQAAVTLSNLLSTHGRVNDDWIRETYNDWVRRSWESIYDFISVHYHYSAGDTAFWEAMESIDVSPRTERFVEEFDRNGFGTHIDPTQNDDDLSDLLVFRPINFYEIMRKMGATSAFYEDNQFDVSEDTRDEEEQYYRSVTNDVNNYLSIEEVYRGLLGE